MRCVPQSGCVWRAHLFRTNVVLEPILEGASLAVVRDSTRVQHVRLALGYVSRESVMVQTSTPPPALCASWDSDPIHQPYYEGTTVRQKVLGHRISLPLQVMVNHALRVTLLWNVMEPIQDLMNVRFLVFPQLRMGLKLVTKPEPSCDVSPKQDTHVDVHGDYPIASAAINSRDCPKSYDCSRSARNVSGNGDYPSASSLDPHQQVSLDYYLDNILCQQFPHVDPPLIPMITNLIRRSEVARECACMLANIVRQRTCPGGLEPVEPENLSQWRETLHRTPPLTEGDAFGALCMMSCALLSGGKGQWQTFLDAACEFCLSFFQSPAPGHINATFRQCSEDLLFVVKTTIWFDILGSVTLVRAPRMLDIIRVLMAAHGSSSGDESTALLGKYSMLSVIGCENDVILCLAEVAFLAHWKAIHDAAGNLDIVELVERGQKIEQALNGPALSESRAEPTKPQTKSHLTTEILRASAYLYLHSVISGDRPRCTRIIKAVDETVARVKEADTIYVGTFTLLMSACLANNLDHRTYLLERLRKQQAGSAVKSPAIWPLLRESWQETSDGSVDWRRTMRDADIPLI
ncbi:fungal-specific transcription factor domain-containing protein [Phlebopus sp. FC_14]|nr:fungal-specific transcription factor domain-containing protein [Phlebopus sp. FC_14]